MEELISSGFLDSDYEEESTETEFESTDNELSEASLEIKENNLNESESPSSFKLIELEQEELSSPSSQSSSSNNLNMVLSSDISVVDEFNVSNSESINDATINQIIDNNTDYRNIDNINDTQYDNEYKHEQYENEYNSDDQVQEIQQFDIVTSKSIIRFMEFVFSDVKYLMILFILMVACPHIIDRLHHENDNDGIPQFYGGGVHSGYRGHNGCYHERTIHWNVEHYAATTHSIINDEDDERDEYQNDDDDDMQHQQDQDQNKDQCIKKQHILSFDIMTTTFDMNKKLRRAHLEHHEIKITPPSDLCNNNNRRMRIRNIPIPREIPRLFMNIGGLSSVRGFKSTSIASVGRHFGQTQGLYALVMAFVGIAGFAASNNIDEIMSITISS